jgi:hypothetical protein
VVASPLERAPRDRGAASRPRSTCRSETDDRLIEAGNYFEGKTFGVGDGALLEAFGVAAPAEPVHAQAGASPTRRSPLGCSGRSRTPPRRIRHEVVLVSHQLPVWTVRNKIEGKRLWHDPRKRECSLASLTSLRYTGDDLTSITYTNPPAELLAARPRRRARDGRFPPATWGVRDVRDGVRGRRVTGDGRLQQRR